MGLAALGIAGIFALNSHSLQLLTTARQSGSASQVLQQRTEALRILPWSQITNRDVVTLTMSGTKGATDSESEMTSTSHLTETVTISTYRSPGETSPSNSFTVVRQNNSAAASGDSLLDPTRDAQTLALSITLRWEAKGRPYERSVRTLVSKTGLVAAGIPNPRGTQSSTPVSSNPTATPTASATPIPATTASPTPQATVTPTPTPVGPLCMHDRELSHCGHTPTPFPDKGNGNNNR